MDLDDLMKVQVISCPVYGSFKAYSITLYKGLHFFSSLHYERYRMTTSIFRLTFPYENPDAQFKRDQVDPIANLYMIE